MEIEINKEDLIAGKQDWNGNSPVFYIKYRWSKRYERITIKEAIPLLNNWFPMTDSLREWMKTSKYKGALANQ